MYIVSLRPPLVTGFTGEKERPLYNGISVNWTYRQEIIQLHTTIPHNLAGRQQLKEADVRLSLIGWSSCYGLCYWLAVNDDITIYNHRRRWRSPSQQYRQREITGTRQHTVVRPMQKSIGKWEIRPPCKIVTSENIILILCTRDYRYVGEVTRHANFGFNRHSGGLSPNRRNITTSWLFLTVLSLRISRSYAAQVKPLDRFMAQTMCFRAEMVLMGVERWVTIFRGKMLPKLPKNGCDTE